MAIMKWTYSYYEKNTFNNDTLSYIIMVISIGSDSDSDLDMIYST